MATTVLMSSRLKDERLAYPTDLLVELDLSKAEPQSTLSDLEKSQVEEELRYFRKFPQRKHSDKQRLMKMALKLNFDDSTNRLFQFMCNIENYVDHPTKPAKRINITAMNFLRTHPSLCNGSFKMYGPLLFQANGNTYIVQ